MKLIRRYKRYRYADKKGWNLFGLAIIEYKKGNFEKGDLYLRNANRIYRLLREGSAFKEKPA